MGNCVTGYKNKDPAAMNSAQIRSPTEENFVKTEHSNAELGSKPQLSSMEQEASSPDLSKTEEKFFDATPWLESDCEDFFSVNGDSTSSRGNSPIHLKSFTESSQTDKNHSIDRTPDAAPEHSPTETKKLLIEFFRKSFNDDPVKTGSSLKELLEDEPTTSNLPPKYATRSPPTLFAVLKRLHTRDTSLGKKNQPVRNMSFGERKKG